MAAFVLALLQSRHQAGRKGIQGCAELYINTKPQKVRCLSSLSTNRYLFLVLFHTVSIKKKNKKGESLSHRADIWYYLMICYGLLWYVYLVFPPFLSHIATPILAYPRQSSRQSSGPKAPDRICLKLVGGQIHGFGPYANDGFGVARYLAAKGMLGVFHAGTKAGSASAWNWMNQNRSKIAANPENCSTAPKIHMEPENGPLQFEIPCWKSSFSGFMLKFQECTW